MNLYELTSRVIEALEAEDIAYMVVGALSSSVFGIPRATKDSTRSRFSGTDASEMRAYLPNLVRPTPARQHPTLCVLCVLCGSSSASH